MKKLLVILMMAAFLQQARADMLSDIFNGNYVFLQDIPDNSTECEKENNDLGEDHELDNGDHYSWDDLYLCSYCYNPEVIIDPYGSSEDEVWFSY